MAELNLPVIDAVKCTLCGICVDACPEEVLALEADTLLFSQPERCTLCAECETVCPETAVACYYQISWAE